MFNYIQTPVEALNLDSLPNEIVDQFYDFINNVPFIKELVSGERKRAKDLERDETGKIIVDITHPHILEDMDYFRPTAIHYQKYGTLTDLRPNANRNSEYGKWVREEIRRCYEGFVRPSDGEWITGDYYFFLNYCPMLVTKKVSKGSKEAMRVIDFPDIWEGHYYKFHYLQQARQKGLHAAELASRGKGKAHPYSEKILTPDGWKIWRDIQIGDTVYGDDGIPTKVIDIPYDDYTDIYEISLIDGRKVKCSGGHLFRVKDHKKKKERVVSCEDMLSDYLVERRNSSKSFREFNYRIPVNGCLCFESQKTSIDPYTLGVLLGDGCFRNTNKHYVSFTSHENDIEWYIKNIPYEVHKICNDKYTYNLKLDTCLLGDLWNRKSEDKYIPSEYIFNGQEARFELLQGLMDTDGTVTFGTPVFTTTSERLKDDVILLARSLGYNCSISSKIPTYKGKPCKRCWNIRIYAGPEVFKLPRKAEKVYYSNTSRCNYTAITKIEKIGREKAKCITVDNQSHCYLINDFIVTHNSFCGAAMLAKRFILGESEKVRNKVTCYITASDKTKLVGGDQTLDKFQYDIDFCAEHTQFPSKRLRSSIQDMQWQMGYLDLDSGVKKGTLNAVVGKSSANDASKLRGSRGVLYVFEEAGTFPNLLELWNNLLPSVENGSDVFGMLYLFGTAGDEESDFSAAQEIMYNPDGYHVLGMDNVFDKEGQGRRKFTFFFPGYLNRANCYDQDGNSDVTKALLEILIDRYNVKYNSTNVNTITKRIAEIPITPQEAILRSRGNMFPVTDLTERLNEIENDPSFYDDVYVGDLVSNKDGTIGFKPTGDQPIRTFPLKDNKMTGAIEIFNMPELDAQGKPFAERYIVGLDPVDDDGAATLSLSSTFVLDLWTDQIVAEYTGRQQYADDNYEITRKLCLFYNARCCYENNKKGIYAYFSRLNCLYLLADTPEYLKDRDLVKITGVGNKTKGIPATKPINDYANRLIRDWLLKGVPTTETVDGEVVETTIFNLYRLRNKALIKELIMYNPDINVDRVRALGMVMLYREEFMIRYGGSPESAKNVIEADYLGNDEYFTINYDRKFLDRKKPFN